MKTKRSPIVQQRQIAEGVYKTVAAWATLVPRRVEHEMVDGELAVPLEILFPVRAVENITFFRSASHWSREAIGHL